MDLKNIIDEKECTGCMACKNICPKNAIKIISEKDGFEYPKINENLCINCGYCKKICPVINNMNRENKEPKIYACKNKNEQIRLQSSSGGIFTLIAEWIIKQDGIVFGAKLEKNMIVSHNYIENIEDIVELRGSKYVQSQIGETYKKVKEFLLKNKKVFFSGTPCQIEGLLAYLGKEYENLYTQDIICHGVPSPKVWKKFLEYKRKKNGQYPIQVNFRNKNISGWSNYNVNYKYSKAEENINHKEDEYMKLFLKNYDLRKSCYQCKFKKVARNSDITLADFWGINRVNAEFNDEKGISAIIVHSKKGREIFENIKNNMEFISANIDDIKKYNPCIYIPADKNELREEFFYDLETNEFEEIIKKYL